MNLDRDVVIKPVTPEYLDQANTLEKEGFPPDERASLETLAFRQHRAPRLFQGYFVGDRLIGFVCGTRYDGDRLEEESMSEHRAQAENLCVHSVCVTSSHRRKGIALSLLRHLLEDVVPQEGGLTRVLLLCKQQLIPLYTKAGFSLVGKSHIIHGADPWYEMKYTVDR